MEDVRLGKIKEGRRQKESSVTLYDITLYGAAKNSELGMCASC